MVKKLNNKGLSLIELLVVIAIISILAGIATPQLIKYYKEYKFWDYASQMEYLVKQAKIYAMESTVNVAVCVKGDSSLVIENRGTSRDATLACNATNICSGNNPSIPCIIRKMDVKESDKSDIKLAGSGASFDPRGLAILPGSTCATYSGKFVKIHISRAGISKEVGSGGCS